MWFRGLTKVNNLEILDGGSLIGLGVSPKGRTWYVSSTNPVGSNSYDGKSWSKSKLTIAAAVALASAGDTIAIRGSFNEPVTCSLAGITFIGCDTGPQQAIWTAPAVASVGSWCLKLTAEACLVRNIKFRPVPFATSGAVAGIWLAAGSSYTRIIGCRFQGRAASHNAIYCAVPVGNVEIDGNEFIYMNTLTHGAAIYGLATAGSAHSAWKITNNIFNSCVTAINIDGRACVVEGNKFLITGLAADNTFGSAVCTLAVDLSGTDTGANLVTKNVLAGTYGATLYKVGTTGDCWFGNFTYVATLAPYGLSIANPD